MNGNPSAEQKRWHNYLRSKGCVICRSPGELHHVVGSRARNNKIRIGEWFVLPLCYYCHRDPRNLGNVTNWKKRFEMTNGTQKELFEKIIFNYSKEKGKMPFDQETYDAIMSY